MPPANAAAEWFWVRVAKTEGCWEWQGSRLPRGYGILPVDGRNVYAHRFSYTLHHGPIANGRVVMHSCDNPPCVNPDHLSVGTQADNRRDCAAKGRNPLNGNQLKTRCKRDHDLTVTARLTGRGNQRVCTECERQRLRRRQQMIDDRGRHESAESWLP